MGNPTPPVSRINAYDLDPSHTPWQAEFELAGAAEAVLFRNGFLTEASASNVFIVQDGVILANEGHVLGWELQRRTVSLVSRDFMSLTLLTAGFTGNPSAPSPEASAEPF